jgi:CRISPR/Cas system CSM-associated protein Csm3 (group 7 of RAMP superfamily)
MRSGKLDITQTKKGKIIVNVLFEGKKGRQTQVTVQNSKITDLALSGNDIEFEMVKGQVVKIMCEDKEIFSKEQHTQSARKNIPKRHYSPTRQNTPNYNTKSQTSGQLEIHHVEAIKKPASAPYNFIPLNDKVVEAEQIPDFDKYHEECYTGHIDLNIETITPLYIRDTLNEKEMVSEEINSDFFSPGGLPKIPGSTLRGMTRTMVEMTSFGKFRAFDDKGLYFRGLADMSNLRNEYQSKMGSRYKQEMSAGFLIKIGFDYFIRPASGFKQIPKSEAKNKIKGYEEFKFYKIKEGWIIVSGDIPRKKKDWLIFPPNSDEMLPISGIDVRNYNEDTNRSDEVPNLIKETDKKKKVPCFYVSWRDNSGRDRISFGHTGMFRLAYEKSIGDHIPKNLKAKNIIDIPEAIFGNAEKFAGRVFFEDAVSSQQDVIMEEKIPRILASPKPTTFQHYLVQPYERGRNRSNYNDNTAIRGNKLYWHQSGENWVETDPDRLQNENIITKIKPVKPETKFNGRIRFENLSQVELGALLFALDLPQGCFHKLGMGKPLGLGSVKIVPTLHLSDRVKRYEKLFDEWNNDIQSCQNLSAFKANFETYILKHTGESKRKSLWETERLNELKYMLDYKRGIDLEKKGKIRYMEITGRNQNEFRNRLILPKPSGVR